MSRDAWAGKAGPTVRSMNEIYSKTSASKARCRPSSLQLSSSSRICSANREISAAECKSAAAKPSKRFAALRLDTSEMVSNRPPSRRVSFPLPDPCQMVLTDFEAWRDWAPGVALARQASFMQRSPLEGRVAPHTDPEHKWKPRCYCQTRT